MKLKCIVIDDEPLARKGLKEYINDTDFLEFAAEFDNPMKAAEMISNGEVDLIFLDIEMPRINGISFLKSIAKPPPVIFTTAYPQYALESFEVNALDYLVKPVSFERFLKATLKAKENHELHSRNVQHDEVEKYFFIKSDNKLVKIKYEDILFAEALQNYVVIHTKEKKFITYLTFRAIEEYLPSTSFIKTHKSYIVAADKIETIEGNEIRIGQHSIPISRNLKDDVMEKLLRGKFLKR